MNCLNVFSVVVSRFRIIVALISRERLYFFSCDQRDYNTETRNNHRKHIETIHEPEGFSCPFFLIVFRRLYMFLVPCFQSPALPSFLGLKTRQLELATCAGNFICSCQLKLLGKLPVLTLESWGGAGDQKQGTKNMYNRRKMIRKKGHEEPLG